MQFNIFSMCWSQILHFTASCVKSRALPTQFPWYKGQLFEVSVKAIVWEKRL